MAVLKDLIEKRAKLIADARALNDSVPSGKFTPEQESRFKALNDEADGLKAAMDRQAKLDESEAADRAAQEADEARAKLARDRKTPGLEDVKPGAEARTREQKEALAFAGWCRSGTPDGATAEQKAAAAEVGFDLGRRELAIPRLDASGLRSLQGACREFRGSRREREMRDMSLTGASGGYSVLPGTLVRSLETARLMFGGVRQVAEVIRTETGEPLYYPAANDTGNVGALVAEAGDTDLEVSVDPTFSRLQLDAFKIISTPILVSYELLRDSVFDLPSMIGAWLGERIGRKEAAYFATGTGSSQPKGITVAGTAATLSSGNAYTASATAITGDEILDLVYSVDPAYRGQGCGFLMKDSTVLLLRKLKGSDGQYLWQPNWQTGAADMLAGYPVHTVQEMPAATAALKSVVFGQLNAYKVRDVGSVRVKRLDELYANTDQVAFMAYASVDGDLLDAGTHPVKVLVQHA